MMLYPSIDDLLNKINSKYSLVVVAAERARQMQKEKDEGVLKNYRSVKNVGKALEEIYANKLTLTRES